MIKKFEEFINENCCSKSWNDDDLDKYISNNTHEPEGMFTDDDGSFELGDEPEFTANDLNDDFFRDYGFDDPNVEFVGLYAYYNNIKCEPENEDELIMIWYNKAEHKFDKEPIDSNEVWNKYRKK